LGKVDGFFWFIACRLIYPTASVSPSKLKNFTTKVECLLL